MKVGGKVPLWKRVMAGCEMLPCSLSQESSSSGVELPSPLCHYKHTLMTKCVIDVHLKVKAGVFLWTYWSPSLTHTLFLSNAAAFKLLNHCHHWLKGFRQTWCNKGVSLTLPCPGRTWDLASIVSSSSIKLESTTPQEDRSVRLPTKHRGPWMLKSSYRKYYKAQGLDTTANSAVQEY